MWKALIEKLANKLAVVQVATLTDNLTHVEAKALFDALAERLAQVMEGALVDTLRKRLLEKEIEKRHYTVGEVEAETLAD